MRLAHRLGRPALALMVLGLALGAASCARHPEPTWVPPSLSEVRKELVGVSFGQFVSASQRLCLLRSPQTVTELGLAEEFGVRNDRLDDYSSGYLEETLAIEREILSKLRSYPRSVLSPDDQAAYDAWEEALTDLVAEQGVSPAVRGFAPGDDSATARLMRRFAAVDLIRSEADLVDYITCLHQAARQIRQMQSWLEREARRGILPGRDGIIQAIAQLSELRITETYSPSEYLPEQILSIHHPFFAPLRDYLVEEGVVHPAARAAYLGEANRIIAHQVIPAYEKLAQAAIRVLNQMGGVL